MVSYDIPGSCHGILPLQHHITYVSLFGSVIYSCAGLPKYANTDARRLEIGAFDGRDDGEHFGVTLVEIAKLFAIQDCFSKTGFDRVYLYSLSNGSVP